MNSYLKQIINQRPSERNDSASELFNCQINLKSIELRLHNASNTSDQLINSPPKSETSLLELKNLKDERNQNKLRKLVKGKTFAQLDSISLQTTNKLQANNKALSVNIMKELPINNRNDKQQQQQQQQSIIKIAQQNQQNLQKNLKIPCKVKIQKCDNFLSHYEDKISELFRSPEEGKQKNIPSKTINLKSAKVEESPRSQISINTKRSQVSLNTNTHSKISSRRKESDSQINTQNKQQREKQKLQKNIMQQNINEKILHTILPKSKQSSEKSKSKEKQKQTLKIAGLEFTTTMNPNFKQGQFKSSSFANTIEKAFIQDSHYFQQYFKKQRKNKMPNKEQISQALKNTNNKNKLVK